MGFVLRVCVLITTPPNGDLSFVVCCYATDLTTGDVVMTHQYYIAYGDVTEKVSDSVSLHVCFCTVSWVWAQELEDPKNLDIKSNMYTI